MVRVVEVTSAELDVVELDIVDTEVVKLEEVTVEGMNTGDACKLGTMTLEVVELEVLHCD